MTRSFLDLRVGIGNPYDVRAVVRECRRILGTPDAVPPQTIVRRTHPLLPGGSDNMLNPSSWDVPAGLWVDYGIDGPLRDLSADDAIDEQRHSVAADPATNGWAAAVVKFTPVFWWPEISGTGASDHDLGAWLISKLGRWLDQRRLPWQWTADGAPVHTFPTAIAFKTLLHSGMPTAVLLLSRTLNESSRRIWPSGNAPTERRPPATGSRSSLDGRTRQSTIDSRVSVRPRLLATLAGNDRIDPPASVRAVEMRRVTGCVKSSATRSRAEADFPVCITTLRSRTAVANEELWQAMTSGGLP
jgi:hypothetical protein